MSTMSENETYTLPPAVPYENHGRTKAGWTMAWGCCIAALVIGLGVIFSEPLAWAGVGVLVLSLALSYVLLKTGKGQPRSLTDTAKGGAWYED